MEEWIQNSGSISTSSSVSQMASSHNIKIAKDLIPCCFNLYMNKNEVIQTLLTTWRIDPGLTTLAWQQLEEENPEFFRAYYQLIKLSNQIQIFNRLLEHQALLMKWHQAQATNLPMGYPVLQQPPISGAGINLLMGYPVLQQPPISGINLPMGNSVPILGAGQQYLDSISYILTPPGNSQPMQMNSRNDMVMDNSGHGALGGHSPFSALDMSKMAVDTSALGDSPFSAPGMSKMGVDTSALDGGGVENSRDSLRSLDQKQWNFSLSDLMVDLSNWGDLGILHPEPEEPFPKIDEDIYVDIVGKGGPPWKYAKTCTPLK